MQEEGGGEEKYKMKLMAVILGWWNNYGLFCVHF